MKHVIAFIKDRKLPQVTHALHAIGGVTGMRYLVNPVDRLSVTVKGNAGIPASVWARGVLVKADPMRPALWIVTADASRLEGTKQVSMASLQEAFEVRRRELAAMGGGAVDLGREGPLETGYDVVERGGEEDVCLKVVTPAQTLYLTEVGGKVWKWDVGGADLVRRGTHANSGVGMDLLWVPARARWSGDENRAMRLVECRNNGDDVRVTFSGELASALPGLMLEKTYTIPGEGAWVDTRVRYRNDTPLPVTLSYWSHNWFAAPEGNERSLVILRDGKPHMPAYGALSTRVYINQETGPFAREHVMTIGGPEAQCGPAGPAFGEYFTASRLGLAFRVPDDFLQIYRWETPSEAGLEWMHRPVTLQPAEILDLTYRMEAHPGISLEEFGEKLAATVTR